MTIRACAFAALIYWPILGTTAVAQQHSPEHVWDYSEMRGPSLWGVLKPEFALCKDGQHQSPIDIHNPRKTDLPSLHFEYRTSPLHITDNGHTVMISYASGSVLSVNGKKYVLKQFHFHQPSEEKINGSNYAMVIHLVHADDQGNLAVVAVLIRRGKENSVVRKLWSNLPQEKDKEESPDGVLIDAAGLLPTDRGYYTYSGSLTTPPCTENVTWFVLKSPVTLSAAQLERFSNLYAGNARPVQPLHDRVVLETQ